MNLAMHGFLSIALSGNELKIFSYERYRHLPRFCSLCQEVGYVHNGFLYYSLHPNISMHIPLTV